MSRTAELLAVTALALLLAAIGAVLVLVPGVAAEAFGAPGAGPGLFARATGTREIVLGVVALVLALARERRALALHLLVVTAVPLTDTVLALHAGADLVAASRHAVAVPLVLTLAVLLLRGRGVREPVR